VSGIRPPLLVHEGTRGRDLRRRSWILWLAVAGTLCASVAMILEIIPGADDTLTMAIAMLLVTGGAVMADRTRRRIIVRAWQVEDGVLIETTGLLRPARRFFPQERARLARVGPADPRGSFRGMVEVRMPGELGSYLYEPQGGLIPFGDEKPRRRRRR
jgi:hypothetical protein